MYLWFGVLPITVHSGRSKIFFRGEGVAIFKDWHDFCGGGRTVFAPWFGI